MKKRLGAAVAALGIGLVALAGMPSASAAEQGADTAAARPPATLVVPGDAYYPESITAAANGDLYVASITTGEIVRFVAGVWTAETFVPVGVNLGTAGVLFDDARKVLWACDIDLSFQQPTKLKAFNSKGDVVASYTVPDRGVCADIVLVGSAVFITDTVDPTVQPALPGRILKLTTPSATSAVGGTLSVWSADSAFTYPTGGLQINGIAYDGKSAIYTTNYSAGTLMRVGIAADGSPLEATKVPIPRLLQNPDGIRMLDRYRLLVTENPGALSVIDVRSGAITQVGTFDQPTSVVRSGGYLWVAEGQVLRLQQGQPPNLPFKIQRAPVPIFDL
jgi:sugar lactone lactonase YvrE